MDDKDFEKLLRMARSENLDTINLAVELANNSDLPIQDKATIARHAKTQKAHLQLSAMHKRLQAIIVKSLNPFKKQ